MMLSILQRKLFIKELAKILVESEKTETESSPIEVIEITEKISEELNEEESVLN